MITAKRLWFSLMVSPLTIILAFSSGALAQTVQGSILGTVTDESGAVTVGATITVTNLLTHFKRVTSTNSEGFYDVPHLDPAEYSVTAELSGFKKYIRDRISLEATVKLRIDIKLSVGQVTDQVSVEAQTPVITTETGQVGTSIKERTMRDMALGARDYGAFLHLTPGAGYGMRGYSYNGSRSDANDFTIDGIDMRSHDTGAEQGRYAPDFELLKEIRVDSVNNTAEFAHPGSLSQVLKSGANQFHGQGTWQFQNGVLNARSFYAKDRPKGLPVNTVFFSGGGPVVIPRVYDGHDRTFFFVHYQRKQLAMTQALLPSNVPTPAMRNGDLAALGKVIRDPLTGQPFAGSIIPSNRIQPAAVVWMKRMFPLPTEAFSTPLSNYVKSDLSTETIGVKAVRVDHKLTEKNTFYGQYFWSHRLSISGDSDFGREFFGDRVRPESGGFIIIGDTHTFSPSVINEFRAGYNREGIPYGSLAKGKDYIDAMGLRGYPALNPDAPGTPGITITGLQRTITEITSNYRWNNYNAVDNLSIVKGSHLFKTGVNVLHHQYSNFPANNSLQFGTFQFDGFASGDPFADFLLGIPRQAQRQNERGPFYGLAWDWGVFFQDDWKLVRNFTLNWGVRYERHRPWREKYGRISSFDISTGKLVIPDEGIGAVDPRVLASIPYSKASDSSLPQNLVKADSNDIAPRLGFAWRTGFQNLVVRGGYGLYYNDEMQKNVTNLASGVFVASQTFDNALTNGAPLWQWPDAFPSGGGRAVPLLDINAISPKLLSSYVHQWNLTLEKEIGDFGIRVSYIGSSGIQQPIKRNINQPYASTTPFTQSRRPYPQFNNIMYVESGGNSSYNSFQAQLQRRFSKGFQVNANYTWAKNLSNVEDHRTLGSYFVIEDAYNRARDKGNVEYGVGQRFVTDFLWEIPIGRGRSFLSGAHPIVNGVLGGWDMSGALTASSGPWWTPQFNGRDISNTNKTTGRPDRICDGNLPSDKRNFNSWFDLSCFARPAVGIGRFGNSGKGIIEGPGIFASTMGLFKYLPVPGPENLKLRVQAYFMNLFNHPLVGGNITSFPGIINVVDGARITGQNQDTNNFTGPNRTIRVGLRLEW